MYIYTYVYPCSWNALVNCSDYIHREIKHTCLYKNPCDDKIYTSLIKIILLYEYM